MEREIRAWWNDLSRADQETWIATWESGRVSPEAALTIPAEYANRWTTDEERPSAQLADFLEQQAASRFLNLTEADQPRPR